MAPQTAEVPPGAQLVALANGSRDARVCIGADSPDNLYQNATIDAAHTYRLLGKRGTVHYLGLSTNAVTDLPPQPLPGHYPAVAAGELRPAGRAEHGVLQGGQRADAGCGWAAGGAHLHQGKAPGARPHSPASLWAWPCPAALPLAVLVMPWRSVLRLPLSRRSVG